MKPFRVLVVPALVLLAAACGSESGAPSGAETVTSQQCRRQWVDLWQYHGENGNPGSSVAALADRWEDLDAQARDVAEQAEGADCGATFDDLKTEWGALEDFMYDLHELDPARQLATAEGDRRYYAEYQEMIGEDGTIPPALRRAFQTARREAPQAVNDLAPAMQDAAQVEVTDKQEVRDFLLEVKDSADSSESYGELQQMLRIISDAELNEH